MLSSLLQVRFGVIFFWVGWLKKKRKAPKKDAAVRFGKFEMLHRYVAGSSLSRDKSVAVRRKMELF